MQIKIYAIVNPLDNSAFYVGATGGDLTNRRSGTGNFRKKQIIDSIKSLGAKHEMLLLDEVPHIDANFWEQFYMDLFKSWGFDLTNKRKSNYTTQLGDWASFRDELKADGVI